MVGGEGRGRGTAGAVQNDLHGLFRLKTNVFPTAPEVGEESGIAGNVVLASQVGGRARVERAELDGGVLGGQLFEHRRGLLAVPAAFRVHEHDAGRRRGEKCFGFVFRGQLGHSRSRSNTARAKSGPLVASAVADGRFYIGSDRSDRSVGIGGYRNGGSDGRFFHDDDFGGIYHRDAVPARHADAAQNKEEQ